MSTAQWANIDDDEGATHALIQRIAGHISIDIIDYLWIFPPRKVAAGESVVVVVAAFDEETSRRRVFTARFTISRNRKGIAKVIERMDEHGAAPEDAVPRIVQGVLRRLGEDTHAEPRAELISGDIQRWDALVVDLGGKPAPAADDILEDAVEAAGEGSVLAAVEDAVDGTVEESSEDLGPDETQDRSADNDSPSSPESSRASGSTPTGP
ncbi:MAG TPA: hypothetical protein VK929_08220 [Longimicrobiales bacterium]|nr:hypothetical protein [Longimicrobiales bacterium]